MSKSTTSFVCQQCGSSFSKWNGKCPQCNSWGSLVETIISRDTVGSSLKHVRGGSSVTPVALTDVSNTSLARKSTGISELDRVLGGGIVPGMAVLIAGEPGIGKSTLLLELATKVAQQQDFESGILNLEKNKKNTKNIPTSNLQLPNSVLYVAGEESPEQIKIRANRLGVGHVPITLFAETDVDAIVETIRQQKPSIVIIDSIQTLTTQDLSSPAASVGQIRESVDRLTRTAKNLHIPMFFIGHITKEGSIAGPKIIEHIVDTVLLFSGEETYNFRELRTIKNRFGSTNEVGIFSMEDEGLNEVKNPSLAFLSAKLSGVPGSVVVPTVEGTRPILVEVQALVAPSTLVMPRRVGIGVDYNRLQFLLALLSKRVSGELAKLDVFVNVVGGLKVHEPALDLGICMAVASAYNGGVIHEHTACFGEVGLLGEIRNVRFASQRIKEAQRLGYTTIIGPEQAKSLTEAIALVFGKKKGR